MATVLADGPPAGSPVPLSSLFADIGTLGGATARVHAVGEGGHVVGESETTEGTIHAFVWTPQGGMVDLGVLPGTNYSAALAVNASGQVVGVSGPWMFLWTEAGGMVDLGFDGTPVAISDAGHIVGIYDHGDGPSGFFFSEAYGWEDFGVGYQPVAVNGRGQVAGSATWDDGEGNVYSYLFLFTVADGTTTGDEFSGTMPFVVMNERGDIAATNVYEVENEGPQYLGFLWRPDSGGVEIGPVIVTGINDSRQVAGWDTESWVAVSWREDLGLTDLAGAGLDSGDEQHVPSFGINDRGEIPGFTVSGADGYPYLFSWSAENGVTYHGVDEDNAFGRLLMTDSGWLAGTIVIDGSDRAVVWQRPLPARNPQDPLEVIDAPASADYQSSFTVSASGGSGSGVTYFHTSGPCINDGADNQTTVTMTSGTGVCEITAVRTGDATYEPATSPPAAVVAVKLPQPSLSFIEVPESRPFNTTFFAHLVGATSSGAVSFTTEGPCSVEGWNVRITAGTGVCTVTAFVDADDNYEAATSEPMTVSATEATQPVLTVTGAPETAGLGSTFTVGVSGGGGDGDVTFTASGACANSDGGASITMTAGSGTCFIAAEKAGDGNYRAARAHTSYRVLWNFGATGEPRLPRAAVTVARDGRLYGVTTSGGASNQGTIFRFDPSTGSLETLHSFSTASGLSPASPLLEGEDNVFYGTTGSGGANQRGTAFSIDASGNFRLIYSFSEASGRSPRGALLERDSAIFGVTGTAGTYGRGSLFRIDGGTLTVVRHFTSAEGSVTWLAEASDGTVYGLSGSKLITLDLDTGTPTVLRTLGFSPSSLVPGENGSLYVLWSGMNQFDFGGILTLNEAGETIWERRFDASEGSNVAGLVDGGDGHIYGMLQFAAAHHTGGSSKGVVFDVNEAGGLSLLHVLTGPTNLPSMLARAADGTLYGLTSGGGLFNGGTLFEVRTDGAVRVEATDPRQQPLFVVGAPPSALEGSIFVVGTTGGSGTGAVTFTATGACSNADGGPEITMVGSSGSCTITAAKAGDENYPPIESAPVVVHVGSLQAPLTVVGAPASAVYNTTFTVTTAGGSGTGAVSFSVTGVCTHLGGGSLRMTSGTGTCTVTAEKAGDEAYVPVAADPVSVLAAKAAQAALVIGGAPASAAYGSSFGISVTGGSGTGALAVSVDGVCTLTGTLVSMTSGTGVCTVTATKGGDDNYEPAATTAGVGALPIAQAALAVVGAPALAQTATSFTVTAAGGSGTGAVTFAASGACSTSGGTGVIATASTPGACSVTATKAADANYTVAQSPPVTVSVVAPQAPLTVVGAPASAVYNTTFTVTTAGGSGTGAVSFSVTGVCTHLGGGSLRMTSGTGTCTVTAEKAGDEAYVPVAADPVSVLAAKAAQAALVIGGAPASAAYGSSFGISVTGGSGTGALAVSVDGVCTLTGTLVSMTSGTGVCTVTATKGGDDNYEPAATTAGVGALPIAQAALAVVGAPALAQTATSFTVTAAGGSGTGAVTFAASGACSTSGGTGVIATASTPGACSVTATKAADANYTVAQSPPVTVSVVAPQAPLTVVGAPASAVYNTTFTVTTAGGSGTGAVSFSVTGVCTHLGGGSLRMTSGTGTCTVTAEKAGDANYASTSSSPVAVVAVKAPQATIFSPVAPATAAYGTTFTVSGPSGGSGTGSWTYTGSGACASVDGGPLFVMTSGTGVCTINATKAGDANYASAAAPAFRSYRSTGVVGGAPQGGLVQLPDGRMFGVTSQGGTHSLGSVFEFETRTGVATNVHSFDGVQGAVPLAALTLANDGNLYGTTYWGGAENWNTGTGPGGTVFRLNPSTRVLTTVHVFPYVGGGVYPNAYPEGRSPRSSLVQAPDGLLYGTTSDMGLGGRGTLFRLDPLTGNFQTVHAFSGPDGDAPAGLMLASDGTIYGVTSGGGANNNGTIFQVHEGALTTLHELGPTDGRSPFAALLETADGSLWGTTTRGGDNDFGKVFRVRTNGQFTSLGSFPLHHGPEGSLASGNDGLLYGLTQMRVYTVDANGSIATVLSPSPLPQALRGRLLAAQDGSFYGVGGQGVFLTGPPGAASVAPTRVAQDVPTIVDAPETASNGSTIDLSWVGGGGSGDAVVTATGACESAGGTSVRMIAESGPCTVTLTKYGDDSFTNVTSESITIQAAPAARPAITSVSPSFGAATGGEAVTIRGANFTPDTVVTFDGLPSASVTVQDATTIVAIAPVHAVALVDVTVTTSGGTLSAVAREAFAFGRAPAIGLNGAVVRANVAAGGGELAGGHSAGTLSGDGRYLAFISTRDLVVPGDTNGRSDVFLRDLQAGTTEQVNVTSTGVPGAGAAGPTGTVSVTPGGRFVAFTTSEALDPGDTNGAPDVYLRDRISGTTERVSLGSSGSQIAGGVVAVGGMTPDGRYVTFVASGTGVTSNDVYPHADVFVRDRSSSTTVMLSVTSAGQPANASSGSPWVNDTGRFVAFTSAATNLASGGAANVFLRDRDTDTDGVFDEVGAVQTILSSRVSAGVGGNAASWGGGISADGAFVAFHSLASNLVAGDTNGVQDVFLFERATGNVTRVSRRPGGAGTVGASRLNAAGGAISADGRFVVFSSDDAQVVPFDGNGASDVFRYDRSDGTVALASAREDGSRADTNGAATPAASLNGAISNDGRVVAFASDGSNLVGGDFNAARDLFVKTLQLNTPPGAGVRAAPVDPVTGGSPVVLEFGSVTTEGTTSLTTLESPPPLPTGFSVGGVVYDITTTAEVPQGTEIEICISYAGRDVGDESSLRLKHFVNGDWDDITREPVDTLNKVVCGVTTSFSPFAIAVPTPTSVAVEATPSVFGGTTTLSATVTPSGVPGTVTFFVDGGPAIAASYTEGTGVATVAGYQHGLGASAVPYEVRARFVPTPTNYARSQAAAALLGVGKAAATVAFEAGSLAQVYDGLAKSIDTTTSPNGLLVDLAIDGTPVDAGDYAVTATIVDANYEGSARGTLTIARRPASVTLVDSGKAYGEADPVPLSTVTLSGFLTRDSITAAVVTRAPGEDPGSYAMTAVPIDPNGRLTNYEVTNLGAVFTIGKRTALVTFGPAPTPSYLGGAFSVEASTTNTESPVLAYSRVSGPCAWVSGATFTSTGAGTCVVRAAGAATANYQASEAQQAIVIAPAATTTQVVASPNPSNAGQAVTFTATVTSSAGPVTTGSVTFRDGATVLAGSVALSASGTAAFTTSTLAAGTRTIVADYDATTNFAASTGSVSHTVSAATTYYAFTGFFAPIDMPVDGVTVWNTAAAGQAIPVKWLLTLGGTAVSNPASFQGVFSYSVSCSTGAIEAAIEEYATGNSTLTYNGDGNWQYNWKTPKSYAKTCRVMFVKFNDGTNSPLAYFKFK